MALTVDIEKRLGTFHLEAAFSAESGESLALLGASGCGKSLTLKCIAGIETPDRGRITLDGRVLFDSAAGVDLPPQRRRVGYLFQQYALFPNMTVEQNIAVCLDRRKKRTQLEELLAMFRLEEQRRLRPSQLSGGQQQRTALARILASEPEAILLDEPLSALDSFLRWQLEQELWEVLAAFPGPVLWVSHDLGEACRSCRRVCVLEGGRSAPVTNMETLLKNPGTVSAARLSGCKNLVPVRPGSWPGTVEVPDWGLALHCAAPWRDGVTTLGVRAVRPARAEKVNVFSCRILRRVEDARTVQAALYPEDAEPGGPLLWMEVPGESDFSDLLRGERLRAVILPEDLLLLE